MRPEENIEKLIKSLHFKASAELHNRTLNDALEAREKSKNTKSAKPEQSVWRMIMKNRITKPAAACAIIAIAAVLVMYLERATPSAYAIEQTIEANRGIKQLYFEYYAPSDSKVAKECWVEFDETGQPKNVRTNLHKHGGEQLIVQVWREGNTQMWRKEKNMLLCFEAEAYTAKIFYFVSRYDPRRAVETLYEQQKKGRVKVEIEEPPNRSDPIIIRGTFVPGKYLLERPNMPSFRDVLYVDRKTKLVTAIEVYELRDGEDKYRGVWKYSNYDKPFDADVFDLEDELPQDVRRIDMMALDIGVEVGDLPEEEVAVKVVRQFYEALMEKDCAKAIKFMGSSYDPDDRAEKQRELEQLLEQLSVVRIVSIGEPKTRATDPVPALRVPCIIECEKDGEIIKHSEPRIVVGQVLGVLDRWAIMNRPASLLPGYSRSPTSEQ